MRDPNFQVVLGTESGNPDEKLNPFTPENLLLPQNFVEGAGVKKLLTTVPVRKPSKQTFFRVHPSPDYRGMFPVIELKDEREEYVVTNRLLPDLATEVVHKELVLAISIGATFPSFCRCGSPVRTGKTTSGGAPCGSMRSGPRRTGFA
jgi:hypothetical protein